ncbi:MAG: amino acid racemase [Ferruginibacter sp.]
MIKIGLVGGISWSSTLDYYRFINEETNKRLGGLNFAECIIYSVNFNDFNACNAAHDWKGAFGLLHNAALHLKAAGAGLIMLGANTAHIVADEIAQSIDLPLVDIRMATAHAINQKKIKKVGLLGTVFTMELPFYKNKLLEHGIETLIPLHNADREFMEDTLLHELGKGIIMPKTKSGYLRIANSLIERGAEAIILGCTEIPLMLSQDDFSVPVFNTTFIHAKAAVDYALNQVTATHSNLNDNETR